MKIHEAITAIDGICYKPGWKLTAHDHTRRFEDTVLVRVDYHAFNTNQDQARQGFPEEIDTYATFPVMIRAGWTEDDLYKAIIDGLIEIETHETREFFRIPAEDWRAPFHPHRQEGIDYWHRDNPMADLRFGL